MARGSCGERSGRFHTAQGNSRGALRHYRIGVNALETARTLIAPEEMHVAFLRDKLAIYEEFVSALLARGMPRDVAEALETVERAKSRLLLERVQAALEGRTAGRTASPDLEARLAALRAELSRGYHQLHALDEGETRRLGVAAPAHADALATLERAYRAALHEAELASLDAASAAAPLPDVVPALTLQALLRQDEALVEFYIVRERVCAFVITSREIRVFRDLVSLTELGFQSRRLRYQLQRVGSGEATHRHIQRYNADAQAVLEVLYDLLLRPLENALTLSKLVLVPIF